MPEEQVAFEHVNLNEIDPSFKPVDEGMYSLVLGKASRKEYSKKDNPNDTFEKVFLTFTIVDDESFAGRRVFISEFVGQRLFAFLHRIMKATGVLQEEGERLDDYLQRLIDTTPEAKFLGKVEVRDSTFRFKDDGTPEKENVINYYNVQETE